MAVKKRATGAACVALGLLSTWDQAKADDFTFNGTLTPTTNLSDIWFVTSIGACQGGGTFSAEIAPSMPANVTTPFSVTISGVPSGLRNPGDPLEFTIAALYDVTNDGVSVAYDDNTASGFFSTDPLPTWGGSPTLPGYNGHVYYGYTGDTEPGVAADLQSGNYNDILNGELTALGGPYIQSPPTISTFTMVDFSGASNGGTGTIIEVVPEPVAISILAPGILGWCMTRPRRKPVR